MFSQVSKKILIHLIITPYKMCQMFCPRCEKEMEKVVGFPGYHWCRDCHITKKADEDDDLTMGTDDKISASTCETACSR